MGRGRAQTLEFDGLSAYVPGDDVRSIDWRASARSARPHVRRFAAQSHRARMIVLPLRQELYFGTRHQLMAKTGALVAARLAWEALALSEPVGLALPGREILRPRRGRRHVLHLLDELCSAYRQAAALTPKASVLEALSASAVLLARGDEICLIDDFGEPSDALLKVSRQLAERYRLFALILDDAVTRALPPPGAYPARTSGATDRAVFYIGRDRSGEIAGDALRNQWRRTLMDAEWRVTDAADLLPSASGHPR